jgi:hypothetical protein
MALGSAQFVMSAGYTRDYIGRKSKMPTPLHGYGAISACGPGRTKFCCFNKKGCVWFTPYRSIMMVQKYVTCRAVKTNQATLKANECSVSKKLQCYVYIGKSDFDYAGSKYPMAYHNNGRPAPPYRHFDNYMRLLGSGTRDFIRANSYNQPHVTTIGVHNDVLPGLKDGTTLTCKEFKTKFNIKKDRLVDPKAYVTVDEASERWQSELEAWAASA